MRSARHHRESIRLGGCPRRDRADSGRRRGHGSGRIPLLRRAADGSTIGGAGPVADGGILVVMAAGVVRIGVAACRVFALLGATGAIGSACAPIAGIDEKPCVPGCVDGKTRLVCDGSQPRADPCPVSSQECVAPVCAKGGVCGFEPAVGKECGPDGRARCNEGYACIGPHTRLSAILTHTCAVDDAGLVWCWGYNQYGELGDGTHIDRTKPVQVKGLPGPVMDVSAGYAHTCVLTRAGEAWCWGNNIGGQMGTGDVSDPQDAP